MIRVFVGCAANGEDIESQAVLEHSIRKYASEPVEIQWMQLSRDLDSPWFSDGQGRGWRTDLWSTPFSGFRWAVPHLCGFQGRAIYTDSDVIFRADIAELWNQDMPRGKAVLAKGGQDSWRFCVSLWDCREAAKHIPPLPQLKSRKESHREMVLKCRNAPFVGSFQGAWNVIDGEDFADLTDPRVKALHYSAEDSQPQLKHALPRLAASGLKHWFDGKVKPHWRPDLQAMFDAELEEAIAAGFHPERYMPAELFGAYKKQSHAKGYRSHRWARAHA